METPRYAETMAECRALAKASPWIKVTSFGRSPEGRDLPLVIVDKARGFNPKSARENKKAVLMIQAGIHAGEPDGKDAGLLFLRDLCVNKRHAELLDRLVILFVPIFNVDGHERWSAFNRINENGPKEMGWRTTSGNLNLNRDYLKADAPEMRAWLKLHQAWLPDFFVDCHVTDGADYQYVLTYGEEVGSKSTWYLEPHLGGWVRDRFLPQFKTGLESRGVPVFSYVAFREWHNPRSGLMGGPAAPMYSTGYQSAQNRPSVLLETHMLKPYRARVEATREALWRIAGIVAGDKETLLRLNRQADAATASASFRKEPMPLGFTDDGTSELVDFKGYATSVTTSDLTGGNWFTYDATKPETFQIPNFRSMKVTASAAVPEAYLIPGAWTEVIARLDAHGIRYHRLSSEQTVTVASYRFNQVKWRPTSFEGHIRVADFQQEAITQSRTWAAGSIVVPTDQRTARLIVHLLEPASDDSLLKWGFFNAIFEQKEWGESYVLEPLARKMLAKDPSLKVAFDKKKAEDKDFAASPEEQLNWFYNRSEWADPWLNVYPVGKVFDAALAKQLMSR